MTEAVDMDAAMRALGEHIGDVLAQCEPDEDGDRPDGVVSQYVIVAGVVPRDGSGKWLCIRSADAMGQTLASWEAKGLIAAATEAFENGHV